MKCLYLMGAALSLAGCGGSPEYQEKLKTEFMAGCKGPVSAELVVGTWKNATVLRCTDFHLKASP